MSGAPACMDTQLHAALHWRVEPPFAIEAEQSVQIDLAGRLAGIQIDQALRSSGFEADALVVTSTALSAAITMQEAGEACFYDAIERSSGLRPQGIVNAYMCTGWGFALRHFMLHTDVTRLAISVVDVDLHNLAWQMEHPIIGRSGFGVTTLLFTLPQDRSRVPRCSGPHPNSAFNDFVMALKAHQARHGVQPTFIPFTLGPLASTAQRVLAKGSLGPNRNAEFGHCFGADPWIGLIEWLADHPPAELRTVVAGAIAYNGYYTIAPVHVGPHTRTEFRRIVGRVEALEQALAVFQDTAPTLTKPESDWRNP